MYPSAELVELRAQYVLTNNTDNCYVFSSLHFVTIQQSKIRRYFLVKRKDFPNDLYTHMLCQVWI